VTAYEICTLAAPWARGTTGNAALAHDSIPALIQDSWPEIPPALGEAIMACVAADPARRPASMEAFLASIASVRL